MDLIDAVALSAKKCKTPITAELKYATSDNFVGRRLIGYHSDATDFALLSRKAAEKICEVQNYLIEQHHCGLIIYDAYRPKRAVLDIVSWSQEPPSPAEQKAKLKHYPHINKNEIFPLGYVALDSNHCYGNTVDVFLRDLKTQQILEMGACYDFMDELSHLTVGPEQIGEHAFQNRKILCDAMTRFGFESYKKEFWHYALGGITGREVSSPIDIEITRELKGKF